MSTSEIVTLQIGHYSNFVGSHWWNCQESSFIYDPKVAAKYPKEVNHDVLYREGRTLKGEVTYTPRLIAFDLNNSLGCIKREGILYDVAGEEDVKWQGDVTLHQSQRPTRNAFLQDLEPQDDEIEERDRNLNKKLEDTEEENLCRENDDEKISKTEKDIPQAEARNPFYQLDHDVKVWSDFLRTSLHARSMHIIKEHQHNNPEQPFDVFGVGQQVLASRESIDAMEDRVRFFTEECDRLQGFHILLDGHNAFGGFASPILTYLEDEYSSKSRLGFSLTPACPPDQSPRERSCRILNTALSLHSCVRHNSLHIPLCLASGLWKTVGSPVSFPHLDYKPQLDFHTSAILAASLDTFSLPYRKQDDPFKLADISSTFNCYGRKLAALNASVPLAMPSHSTLSNHLMTLGQHDPWISLTPHVKCVSAPSFQSCVVRGLPSNAVFSDPQAGRTNSLLAHCSSPEDVLRLYLTETYPGSINAGCVMRDPIKLDSSFPHIFKSDLSRDGYICDVGRPARCGVSSVPVMTSLQSTPDLQGYLGSLSHSVSQMNISRHQHFLEAGLDPDDFKEMLQDLEDLTSCYTT